MAKRKAEKVKDELRKLTLLPFNKFCMDCAMRGPMYVVIDFNTFVCSQCSALHRGAQHKVKGISMSEFSDEELNGMKTGGNEVAKAIWLDNFRGSLPREGDERAIKEHMRHVYEEKRYYNANAHKEAKANAEKGALPPVQPMPAHIVPSLDKKPAAPASVTVEVQPAPPQPTPAPTPQPTQAPVTTAPPVQTQTQASVSVFDTIFSAPAPAQQVQPTPQQPSQQDPFASMSAPTPAPVQPAPSQPNSDGFDFFSNGPAPQSQAPTQPQMQAAQQQMHSTHYQQTGNAYGAQGQMSGQSNQYATSQAPPVNTSDASMWGAQTAQVQMTANSQPTTFQSTPQYAAQHQMNSGASYGAASHQQPKAGVMDFMAPPAQPAPSTTSSSGGMDFFAAPAPSTAGVSSFNNGNQGSSSLSGGQPDFFSAGPPPIAGPGSQMHAPPPIVGTGTTSGQAVPAPTQAKGPDPFASLDMFKK